MANEKLDILVGVKGARDSENSLKSVSDILNSVSKTATNVNNVLNTFMQSASKHTADLVNQYKTLNQEILKYQQNLQRTATIPTSKILDSSGRPFQNIPTTQAGISQTTGTSFGGQIFRQQIARQQQEQTQEEERAQRWQQTRNRIQRGANRAISIMQTAGGIGQQLGAGDFSGAQQNTYQTVGQAIPFGLGIPLIYKAIKDKVIQTFANTYATQAASFEGAAGLSGSSRIANWYSSEKNKGLMFAGSGYGFNNQQIGNAAASYLRSGGYDVMGAIPRDLRTSRAYGMDIAQVSAMSGELSRYSTGTSLQDIIRVGRGGGVRGQMMGEYTQQVVSAWKEAVSQGINIKNPEKIATSFAILNRAGFRGAEAQAAFQNINQSISSATGMQDARQIMIMRSIRQANPGMTLLESMKRAEQGATPENMRAVLSNQRQRGLSLEERIMETSQLFFGGRNYTQAEKLIKGFDAGRLNSVALSQTMQTREEQARIAAQSRTIQSVEFLQNRQGIEAAAGLGQQYMGTAITNRQRAVTQMSDLVKGDISSFIKTTLKDWGKGVKEIFEPVAKLLKEAIAEGMKSIGRGTVSAVRDAARPINLARTFIPGYQIIEAVAPRNSRQRR